jgi:hypothetical protein
VKVAFDTATLLFLLSPNPGTVLDSSGKPIGDMRERIEFLVEELEIARTQIIVPTPAFSEVSVRAENATSKYWEIIRTSKYFHLEPFDIRAAVEAAEMTKKALGSGKGKRGDSPDPWPKVKFDRQIVAIAKVCGASKIYSQDKGVMTVAHSVGIPVIDAASLPLRPSVAQPDMFAQKPEAPRRTN